MAICMQSLPNISFCEGESNFLSFKIISLVDFVVISVWEHKEDAVWWCYCMSSTNVLFMFTWITNNCLLESVFRSGPEGAVIVVAAFYSSELHGELFDVFINLRPACLKAAGRLLDLGTPCFLHLTCTQESSITCPAWGLRWLVGHTTALKKIKLYFSAQCVQRELFSLMHTPLVYDRSYLHW